MAPVLKCTATVEDGRWVESYAWPEIRKLVEGDADGALDDDDGDSSDTSLSSAMSDVMDGLYQPWEPMRPRSQTSDESEEVVHEFELAPVFLPPHQPLPEQRFAAPAPLAGPQPLLVPALVVYDDPPPPPLHEDGLRPELEILRDWLGCTMPEPVAFVVPPPLAALPVSQCVPGSWGGAKAFVPPVRAPSSTHHIQGHGASTRRTRRGSSSRSVSAVF